MDCSLMTRPSCSMKGVGSFEGQDGLLLALVEGLLPMVVNIPFSCPPILWTFRLDGLRNTKGQG
jgi:hypothetical protein